MVYRVIDAFSGAGGMTLGFVDSRFCGGFESVWAIDNDADAVKTFNLNFGDHGICADVAGYLDSEKRVPAADVVIGGPPCQGFSLLNKNRDGDARRALWRYFLDLVERSGARAFVIENVPGLLTSPEFLRIKARAQKLGFFVLADILLAANYGTPQTRRRAVVIGIKGKGTEYCCFPPLKSHSRPEEKSNLPKWRTVWDAIADLPAPNGTEIRGAKPPFDLHFGRRPTPKSLQRYKAVPPGGNRFDLFRNAPELTPRCWAEKKSGSTDLFGRLWWDRPSVTIRTEFFKPEKGRYLHPEDHRPITHREAARLMGIPDDFKFYGTKISIARQIGNAVPPHMAGAIAREVKAVLDTLRMSKAA